MKFVTVFRALAVTVAILIGSQAQAGFYYQAENTVEDDSQRRMQSSTIDAWVEDQNARIEIKEGDQLGFMQDGSYMLTHDAGETMILVNPKEKTWAEFDMGATMNMANAALDSLGGLMKMEFGDFHMEKLDEGAGDELLGYDTRYLRFRSGYKMTMSIMGRDMSQTVDMDQEMWVTDAIDAEAFSAWMRPDKRLKGMFEGLDKMLEQQYAEINGAPLKAVIKSTMTDHQGKKSNQVTTTVVTTLREENVDDSVFEIPEGYQKAEFMQLGAAQGEDSKKEDDGLSKLKGLFKRK